MFKSLILVFIMYVRCVQRHNSLELVLVIHQMWVLGI